MPETKPEEIELRSPQVRHILGTVPAWIIRWGISLIGIIVLMLIGITCIVSYPDVIPARVLVTTEVLPAKVTTKYGGNIAFLLVKDNESVKKDQVLAVINNAASYQDIVLVKENLKKFSLSFDSYDSAAEFNVKKDVSLGDAQPSYSQFLKSYNDYLYSVKNSFSMERIQQLHAQIKIYQELLGRLLEKQKILESEYKLAEKKWNIDKSLLADKVISQVEFDNTERMFLQEKYKLENIKIEVLQTNLQVQNLQKAITEIRQAFIEGNANYLRTVRQAILNLEASLAQWEERYLLKAAIEGKVSFLQMLTAGHNAQIGEELMVIIPHQDVVMGYAYLTSMGYGKVEKGQKVRINFDSYPFDEFGSVLAEVAEKSPVSNNGMYLVRIKLSNGLTTTYHKTLDFTQKMEGSGFIVTKDLLLIQRIFYQLRAVFDSNVR